jgi:hypothetical protein
MNTLTKFALVITSIVLPLSANAALESNNQDSTTFEKNDVVKLVDKEMKLNTSELVNSLKIEKIALIPDSYSIVLAKAQYKNKQ